MWVAAYGQIFFSLSIGFGIMITYSSYLKPKADLTGSGAVVGFANSGFELLAGIGVFSALGFMAQAAGTQVSDVATSGIGLAFIAFPTIISQAPGGVLIGILFFGSLLFAGFTSLISILEVIIAGVQDKFATSRLASTALVIIPVAVISLLLMPTTTGLYVLDILDNFVNLFGILAAGLCAIIVVAYVVRALPALAEHLNRYSSIKVGKIWMVLLAVVTPAGSWLLPDSERHQADSDSVRGLPDRYAGNLRLGYERAPAGRRDRCFSLALVEEVSCR